jgi:hypothetical protein
MHLNKPVSRYDLAKALKAFLPVVASVQEEKPLSVQEAVSVTPGLEEPAIHSVSSEVKARWPELLKLLRHELEGDWPQLCETPNMDEVEEFANRLLNLAEEYENQSLKNFGGRLKQKVDEFDIESLPQTLESFSQIVEEISEQSDDRPPTNT